MKMKTKRSGVFWPKNGIVTLFMLFSGFVSYSQVEVFGSFYRLSGYKNENGIKTDSITSYFTSSGSFDLRYNIGISRIGKYFDYGAAGGFFTQKISQTDLSQYGNSGPSSRTTMSTQGNIDFRLFAGKRFSFGKLDLLPQLHLPLNIVYIKDIVQTTEGFDSSNRLLYGSRIYTMNRPPTITIGVEANLIALYHITTSFSVGLIYGHGFYYSITNGLLSIEGEKYNANGITQERYLLQESVFKYSETNSGTAYGITFRYRIGGKKVQ